MFRAETQRRGESLKSKKSLRLSASARELKKLLDKHFDVLAHLCVWIPIVHFIGFGG
jgi:hypothetical protein